MRGLSLEGEKAENRKEKGENSREGESISPFLRSPLLLLTANGQPG